VIDDLIAQADRRGLKLNNMFQMADGRWWCEFRDPDSDYPGYGSKSERGDTLAEAMQGAIAKFPEKRATYDVFG